MPLFFFDIRDSQGFHRDDVGLELSHIDAALAEGRRALADMSRDTLNTGKDQDFEIVIRYHDDGPVRLVLSIRTETPSDGS